MDEVGDAVNVGTWHMANGIWNMGYEYLQLLACNWEEEI
jgi:hypothetical protein